MFIAKRFCAQKINLSNINGIDFLGVDFNIVSFYIRVILVYCPPQLTKNFDTINSLTSTLAEKCTVDFPIIILGDFNFPGIYWPNISENNINCTTKNILLDFITQLKLKQHINFPTRNNNILDIILTDNKYNLITSVKNCPPFSISDHNSIEFSLNITKPKTLKIPYLNFEKADYQSMNLYFYSIPWNLFFAQNTDIDSLYTILNDIITEAIKLFVPLTYPKKSYLTQLYQKIRNLQTSTMEKL